MALGSRDWCGSHGAHVVEVEGRPVRRTVPTAPPAPGSLGDLLAEKLGEPRRAGPAPRPPARTRPALDPGDALREERERQLAALAELVASSPLGQAMVATASEAVTEGFAGGVRDAAVCFAEDRVRSLEHQLEVEARQPETYAPGESIYWLERELAAARREAAEARRVADYARAERQLRHEARVRAARGRW